MAKHSNSLKWAHPLVREWFLSRFGTATQPQLLGWPSILKKQPTLISAPTGSGKTFAAFLTCIDQLVRQSLNGSLENKTQVLYISPLKALGNDIHKNLQEPLEEITALAHLKKMSMQEIRVAVRTGDTLAKERQSMLKKAPHILVTTPESFYLLLTAEKSRALLTHIKTVIVDEIHAMANDKRGTHLSLSLERLDAISQKPPIRIGLSATQKPIELVGQFLVGNRLISPVIVNVPTEKNWDLAIEVTQSSLSAVASNELWDEIYDRLAILSNQNRSTLVFVNTRKLAERVAHHLAERLGEKNVATHHGSLSRKLRLNAETRLKNGELKVLVATASLELGIDIGSIDLVCQIGSTRAISVALQRIGRAGHWRGAISVGRIFPTTRDELIECAALIKSVREGDLDELIFPKEPLDILAQQIVAICATGDWEEKKLFQLIKKAFPYQNLSKETFDSVLAMLSLGMTGLKSHYGAYLFRDQVNGLVKARRGARITAIMNGGAIPPNGLFSVVSEPNQVVIGTLDEDFAVESNRGDIILLGSTSWKVKRVESMSGRVIVEDAHGAPPSVPFWRGEAPGRTKELSEQVSNLRQKLSDMLKNSSPSQKTKTLEWLIKYCGVNEHGAKQVIDYILEGFAVLGVVPTQKTIVAERFFDESGGMQLIIHAPFGSRINKAWGLALRKKFCRSFNFELQASATEDGINISLLEQHSFPLSDIFKYLHVNTIENVLTQAVLQSPVFTTRWRWAATRSLALKKFRSGKKIPPNIQRMISEDLLASVFPEAAACQDNLVGDLVLPDHPLIIETMKDIFNEALDLEGLISILKNIQNQTISYVVIDTPTPSAFSHEIINANPYAFLDDAPLEERRARAVEMRQILPNSLLQSAGSLDQNVILDVQNQIWPDIRNEDELHHLLQTLIIFPVISFDEKRKMVSEWYTFFETLMMTHRATLAKYKNVTFWVVAEKVKTFLTVYPDAILEKNLKPFSEEKLSKDEIVSLAIGSWMNYLGPVLSGELSQLFEIDNPSMEQALIKLENKGMILRGHFRNLSDKTEWCERRLLSRIQRLTLDKLRKEIQPVSAAQFFEWLRHWQHETLQTQLSGELGLLEIIKQLQGLELPANQWESQIFSKRIKNYDSAMLDHLCLRGLIGWGRLSSIERSSTKPPKAIRPSRITPISFFVREEMDWMQIKEENNIDNPLILFSHAAKNIYAFLKQKGASYYSDIVKNVSHLKTEIEMGLWELVAAGLITGDSFDNLRPLIHSRKRKNKRRRSYVNHFTMGRWSLLPQIEIKDPNTQMEAACLLLLKRYGVVFRDLLVKEKNMPRWKDLFIIFRRLENQGKIRGGRFVGDFVGEQFALPEAVESLRKSKKIK